MKLITQLCYTSGQGIAFPSQEFPITSRIARPSFPTGEIPSAVNSVKYSSPSIFTPQSPLFPLLTTLTSLCSASSHDVAFQLAFRPEALTQRHWPAQHVPWILFSCTLCQQRYFSMLESLTSRKGVLSKWANLSCQLLRSIWM
jgi:hypothetical protein